MKAHGSKTAYKWEHVKDKDDTRWTIIPLGNGAVQVVSKKNLMPLVRQRRGRDPRESMKAKKGSIPRSILPAQDTDNNDALDSDGFELRKVDGQLVMGKLGSPGRSLGAEEFKIPKEIIDAAARIREKQGAGRKMRAADGSIWGIRQVEASEDEEATGSAVQIRPGKDADAPLAKSSDEIKDPPRQGRADDTAETGASDTLEQSGRAAKGEQDTQANFVNGIWYGVDGGQAKLPSEIEDEAEMKLDGEPEGQPVRMKDLKGGIWQAVRKDDQIELMLVSEPEEAAEQSQSEPAKKEPADSGGYVDRSPAEDIEDWGGSYWRDAAQSYRGKIKDGKSPEEAAEGVFAELALVGSNEAAAALIKRMEEEQKPDAELDVHPDERPLRMEKTSSDPLWDKAVALAAKMTKGAKQIEQAKELASDLDVGYGRAARLLDHLREQDLIGKQGTTSGPAAEADPAWMSAPEISGELWDQARDFYASNPRLNIRQLQKKFGIDDAVAKELFNKLLSQEKPDAGPAEAKDLMNRMEEEGIVGPEQAGGAARAILSQGTEEPAKEPTEEPEDPKLALKAANKARVIALAKEAIVDIAPLRSRFKPSFHKMFDLTIRSLGEGMNPTQGLERIWNAISEESVSMSPAAKRAFFNEVGALKSKWKKREKSSLDEFAAQKASPQPEKEPKGARGYSDEQWERAVAFAKDASSNTPVNGSTIAQMHGISKEQAEALADELEAKGHLSKKAAGPETVNVVSKMAARLRDVSEEANELQKQQIDKLASILRKVPAAKREEDVSEEDWMSDIDLLLGSLDKPPAAANLKSNTGKFSARLMRSLDGGKPLEDMSADEVMEMFSEQVVPITKMKLI